MKINIINAEQTTAFSLYSKLESAHVGQKVGLRSLLI